MRFNIELRSEACRLGVPLWAIAEKLGISESTWHRRLRRELSAEDTEKALGAIRAIVDERREVR